MLANFPFKVCVSESVEPGTVLFVPQVKMTVEHSLNAQNCAYFLEWVAKQGGVIKGLKVD